MATKVSEGQRFYKNQKIRRFQIQLSPNIKSVYE